MFLTTHIHLTRNCERIFNARTLFCCGLFTNPRRGVQSLLAALRIDNSLLAPRQRRIWGKLAQDYRKTELWLSPHVILMKARCPAAFIFWNARVWLSPTRRFR